MEKSELKKQIHQMGYERGYNIASLQDLPKIGKDVGDYGMGFTPGNPIKTIEDAYDVFIQICYEADSNDRQNTSFESIEKNIDKIVDDLNFVFVQEGKK